MFCNQSFSLLFSSLSIFSFAHQLILLSGQVPLSHLKLVIAFQLREISSLSIHVVDPASVPLDALVYCALFVDFVLMLHGHRMLLCHKSMLLLLDPFPPFDLVLKLPFVLGTHLPLDLLLFFTHLHLLFTCLFHLLSLFFHESLLHSPLSLDDCSSLCIKVVLSQLLLLLQLILLRMLLLLFHQSPG